MNTLECISAAAMPRREVGRIADARGQDRVALSGVIRATQPIKVGGSRAYRCVLSDGTGEVDLLFLGRETVVGLAEGTRCDVLGTATTRRGRLTVWNPRYQVLAAEDIPQPTQPEPPDDPIPSGLTAATSASGAGCSAPPTARPAPAADGAVTPGPADIAGRARPAGRLSIYLAAAAGAGKTIAMLDEGQRRRQLGADVVIGFMEDHGRPATRARSAGLETVPGQVTEYHGARFQEMDTCAVLRRHPDVALVDELAHTNLPGPGRHPKRWQDVLDLVDAGIDVITNLNVQHVESLADTVEQITQVRVRERVPDWVVRRADQIELVDSSPEQLRGRMQYGTVYAADQIPQALTHFFRADNLIALRELALRFLADEADEEFLRDLAARRRPGRAPTAERMLVGIGPVPGAEAMIRRAARMAGGIQADLDIVHVARQNESHESGDDGLVRLRKVASDVRATWHDLRSDDDPVAALIEYARNEQATQIVVGSSQRSRWQELASGGSIVTRLSRLATRAGIDVHVVALREE
jgi:two-component system sensor histidine kinase KdpD